MSNGTKKQTGSDNLLAESADETNENRKSQFFNPYLQLFIGVVLTAVFQILLKIGVNTKWKVSVDFFLAPRSDRVDVKPEEEAAVTSPLRRRRRLLDAVSF